MIRNEDGRRNIVPKLFFSFAQIGLFTFGGGYAMLPMLERECVDRHAWAERAELLDYYAIGQCTPGIIAVNCATFIGRKQGGVWGAAAATLGVAFPSMVIITVLSALWVHARDMALVTHAFNGVRVAVAALIIDAVIRLFTENVLKNNPRAWVAVLICAAAFALTAFAGISPVWIVLGAALVGLATGRRAAE